MFIGCLGLLALGQDINALRALGGFPEATDRVLRALIVVQPFILLVAGVAYGWLFWRWGLELAMVPISPRTLYFGRLLSRCRFTMSRAVIARCFSARRLQIRSLDPKI
jgi:hypothetical protein